MYKPELLFVTGPNASGKSSFIRTHTSQLSHFDIIMPDVYKSRTLEVFEKSLKENKNIALETVFNDVKIKDWIDKAKSYGYHTTMIALFLNNPQDSLNRANQRRINEYGLAISKDTVLLNFNENFKNVAQYYFYFDTAEFIYTGANNENLSVMAFEGQTLIRYQSNDFHFIKMFADYAYKKERLDKPSYEVITLNINYSKPSDNQEQGRRFKI